MDPKSKQHPDSDLTDERRDSLRISVELPMRFIACALPPNQADLQNLFTSSGQQPTARSVARIDDELQYAIGQIGDPATRQAVDLLSQKVECVLQSAIYTMPSNNAQLQLSMSGCAFICADPHPVGQACALQLVLNNQFQVIAGAVITDCRQPPDQPDGHLLVLKFLEISDLHRRQYQRFVLRYPGLHTAPK